MLGSVSTTRDLPFTFSEIRAMASSLSFRAGRDAGPCLTIQNFHLIRLLGGSIHRSIATGKASDPFANRSGSIGPEGVVLCLKWRLSRRGVDSFQAAGRLE